MPGRRLFVYDIQGRKNVKAASGNIHGFSVLAGLEDGRVRDLGHRTTRPTRRRISTGSRSTASRACASTRDRKSLNPLWGADGIIHDRQKQREGDAPSYNLFEIQPDGGSLRRITALRIPPLVSGLVPLELSANGKRLLAELEGQDISVGFAVNPETGKVRALTRDFENGFVAANLSADGRTVLGHTGGPNPGRAERRDDALQRRQGDGAGSAPRSPTGVASGPVGKLVGFWRAPPNYRTDPLDQAVEAARHVAIEVGAGGVADHVLDPGAALELDDAELPHAAGRRERDR